MMTNVYCSAKFREIHINIQNRQLSNCCKALPERINLKWLEQNPGRLFLTDTIVEDRKKMLLGQRCHSCDFGCYQQEDKGFISKRSKQEGDQTYVNDPLVLPKVIDIALSTDCNLSCLYCGPEYSLSWTKDLASQGPYDHGDLGLILNAQNKIALKIKQKSRSNESKFFKLVLAEIKNTNSIEVINLLGGEPLLNDAIYPLLNELTDKKITLSTGLGVSRQRFQKFLHGIRSKRNIELSISAESTGKNFEFLRYGANWQDFVDMVSMLEDEGIKFKFNSVITNVSSFDLFNFYSHFSKFSIRYGNVSNKPHLLPNVLDDESKAKLIEKLKAFPQDQTFFKNLKQEVEIDCDLQQRLKCGHFLKEYSRRRKIGLDILPDHFLKWLGLL